ncbi:MAG: GAF domain-containing protein [Deltaproteobacteria bacterium]|nr:GAF domain-containing protein [Deltaproteobacteria bacterium]
MVDIGDGAPGSIAHGVRTLLEPAGVDDPGTREEDLRRREEALREREQRFSDFAENAAIGLHQVGPDGTILWANRAELELLGYSAEEYIGKSIVRFHVDRAVIDDILARLTCGEELHEYEARLRAKDGSVKYVQITSNVNARDGRFINTRCFTRDITERKEFEHYRALAEQRTQQLLKITSALSDAVAPEAVFEAIVDHVRVALDASSAALWLVSEDRMSLRLARHVGYSAGAAKAVARLPMDLEPSIPALDAIRRGESVWISSQQDLVRDYPHLAGTMTPNRSYRICCLPLVSNGTTLGSVGITLEEARESTEDERSFLLLVAHHASQALERLRLFDEERRSRAAADAASHRMSVLSHASRSFGEADIDHAQRLNKIVAEMGALFESHTSISLLAANGRLHSVAHYHPDPEAEEMIRSLARTSPVNVGEGITGTVVSTGKSVLIAEADLAVIASRASPAYRAFFERFPFHAAIVAPLRVRGRIIGVASATRVKAGMSYDQADLEMLEALAERAAAAIETTRLHTETQEARARAEQLYQFAHAAVTTDKVDQVCDAALTAIGKALNTDRAAILLFDDDGVMRFKGWRNLTDEYRRAVEGHTPWARDALAPEPVLISDVAADASLAAYRDLFQRERIGSLAFIPLVSRGQLLGKFMIYYEQAHAYSTNEIDLASAIANHLGSILARFTAVAELESTIRYNELFAGVLAHDLRNPLGSMMMAAQLMLMRQEGQGDLSAKPLTLILSSGQRMTRMIDQLLDFTRARVGGGIEISRTATNLADLCKQAVAEVELIHPDRRIES